jgi:hypothetical protein
MTENTVVRVEITVPGPVGTVWQAFRDPDQIKRWHGWDYEGVEDEIKEIYTDSTNIIEDGRVLQTGGHVFTFNGKGDVTVVRVTRAESPIGDVDWSDFYLDIEEGWLTFLQQLSFAISRHWDETRRSFYVSGMTPDGIAASPARVLDMPSVDDVPVGQKYAVEAPWGPMTGIVWFRSELQTGLTVDEWGDGFLVLTVSPSAEPHGAHHAVVATLYESDPSIAKSIELEVVAHWHKRYKVEAEDD